MRRALFVLFSIPAVTVGAAQVPSPNPPVFLYAAVGPELSTYGVSASNGTLMKTSSVALPFAAKRERVVLDADIQVLALQTRQLGAEHDLVLVVLVDVDRRTPVSTVQHIVVIAQIGLAKDAVDAVLHAGEITERIESNDCHI